jgi:integrase
VLDRRELARLLAATARDDVWERHFVGKRERDRLLLALFAYAGVRRGELLGLDWDDVDLERRLLHVRKAKGGARSHLRAEQQHGARSMLGMTGTRKWSCCDGVRHRETTIANSFPLALTARGSPRNDVGIDLSAP